MSIILFALIGSAIKAGVAYWICFGIFCVAKVFQAINEVLYK